MAPVLATSSTKYHCVAHQNSNTGERTICRVSLAGRKPLAFHFSYCCECEFVEKRQMKSDLCTQGCRAEAAPSRRQQRCLPVANHGLTPRYCTPTEKASAQSCICPRPVLPAGYHFQCFILQVLEAKPQHPNSSFQPALCNLSAHQTRCL